MKEQLANKSSRIAELEREVMMLRSEKSVFELMHATEATERAYYHRFAVEVSAGLGLVGQIVDDVLRKANKTAMHDDGRRGESLPAITIPGFLQNGPREGETNGNASHQ